MGKVVLFSGHMTDEPNRPTPRFPARIEPQVSRAIADALADWQIGPGDLGICGAARGGDILFGEHCVQRGAGLRLFLPLPMAAFLRASVTLHADIDADWQGRLMRLMARATVIHAETGAGDDGPADGPFVANNARMLAEAQRLAAPGAPCALLLWDGLVPDGKGGTAEIAEATRDLANRRVIDPARLSPLS